MDKLLEIMARLRDPEDGCPWDREQDFSSIAPYTIEEAYEVADAIDRDDMEDLVTTVSSPEAIALELQDLPDTDLDGVPDFSDNCPLWSNVAWRAKPIQSSARSGRKRCDPWARPSGPKRR